MSFINYAAKEINCKIVYAGTGLSGKTTNVQYIFEQTHQGSKGKLVSRSTENERTLFFDFLPLSVDEIKGYKTRFHLYTIPGQTFYELSREFILKAVDGIIFVVDSQPERMEANLDSYKELQTALEKQGYDIDQIPFIFQYNKRDVPNAISIQELQATFNPSGKPHFEATANQGKGVMDTLELMTQMVIDKLKQGETT